MTLGKAALVRQFAALGVARGRVLLVHTAFWKAAPVEGGPHGLIEALLAAVGPGGTLVMPSMADDDDIPFDCRQTPCRGIGVVAVRTPPSSPSLTPSIYRTARPAASANWTDRCCCSG